MLIDLAGTCDVQNYYHHTVIEQLVPVVICQLCDDIGHCARNCTYTLAKSSYRFTGRLGSVPEALPVPSTHTEAPLPTPILTVKPVKPVKTSLDRIDCFNCKLYGHFARDCPIHKAARYLCKRIGYFARDCKHTQSGSTVPPPPPPQNAPPPPPLPFNTNHIAMIAKFGGAVLAFSTASFPSSRARDYPVYAHGPCCRSFNPAD